MAVPPGVAAQPHYPSGASFALPWLALHRSSLISPLQRNMLFALHLAAITAAFLGNIFIFLTRRLPFYRF
jgi:hypothetical protein